MQEVTAIFDIGKTNKKFFLFDSDFSEVYREYQKFEMIEDEDGHPTDDLHAIQKWAKDLFRRILETDKYDIKSINFSTYGASFVHLDKDGQPLTPLYNYTKPIDEKIIQNFYDRNGGERKISVETASPNSGMLNSGLQLIWLKETQPEIFARIKYSLHLPQYMSYIFTGIPVSEYTSIGCHTMLWDFQKSDYHQWVYDEQIDEKLAPIMDTDVSINMNYLGKKIAIGIGIHDSSAALIPYFKGSKGDFTLISTGTWSITLSPSNPTKLTYHDLMKDCLNYMTMDGDQVRATRLFLGNEYQQQIKILTAYFKKKEGYHKNVRFDPALYEIVSKEKNHFFHFHDLAKDRDQPVSSQISVFKDFEHAYHQLMSELTEIQIKSIELAEAGQSPERIFIDGGFVDNELFVESLSQKYENRKLLKSNSALGSSLGAALVISDKKIRKKFLKKNYGVKKHKPHILSDY